MNFLEKYFDYLTSNPERIDSIIQWTLCTFVWWVVLWIFRKDFLKGLAGDGRHPGDTSLDNLDAREQIIFAFMWIAPPVVFNVAFFHKVETYQFIAMWASLSPLFYQIFGRYIFDWGLAFWNRQSKVSQDIGDDKKE